MTDVVMSHLKGLIYLKKLQEKWLYFAFGFQKKKIAIEMEKGPNFMKNV